MYSRAAPEEACVGLFFNGIRGCRKSMDDIARVLKSQRRSS
ncbi:MAG: hypothetical protein V8T46_08685 [Sutterella seckii]